MSIWRYEYNKFKVVISASFVFSIGSRREAQTENYKKYKYKYSLNSIQKPTSVSLAKVEVLYFLFIFKENNCKLGY